MELVWPAHAHLASYAAALRRGWSPDTQHPEAAQEQLKEIEEDADHFLALCVDREAKGPPIILPDGSRAERLPGYRKWMWDGEFCGSIGFRWARGSNELPARVLGHIGYSVVPWKRQLGYATRALAQLLPEVRGEGLEWVELTTDPDNLPSQRVILSNGGVLMGRFNKLPEQGGGEQLRFRIHLRDPADR